MTDDLIIYCPRCSHVGGNEVDRARRITIRCQFCGYPKRHRRDRRPWLVLARAARKVLQWATP